MKQTLAAAVMLLASSASAARPALHRAVVRDVMTLAPSSSLAKALASVDRPGLGTNPAARRQTLVGPVVRALRGGGVENYLGKDGARRRVPLAMAISLAEGETDAQADRIIDGDAGGLASPEAIETELSKADRLLADRYPYLTGSRYQGLEKAQDRLREALEDHRRWAASLGSRAKRKREETAASFVTEDELGDGPGPDPEVLFDAGNIKDLYDTAFPSADYYLGQSPEDREAAAAWKALGGRIRSWLTQGVPKNPGARRLELVQAKTAVERYLAKVESDTSLKSSEKKGLMGPAEYMMGLLEEFLAAR